jgi:hypothetical protein
MDYFVIIMEILFNISPPARTHLISRLKRNALLIRNGDPPENTIDHQKLKIFKLPSVTPTKKILCLDLDETLVHSTPQSYRRHDFSVEVLIDKHACLYISINDSIQAINR